MISKLQSNFILLGILLSILLVIGGRIYYQYEKDIIIKNSFDDLSFIANEKANRIIQWQNERISSARTVSQSPFFIDAVTEFTSNKNNRAIRTKLIKRLNLIKENNNYENIFLATSEGKTLIALSSFSADLDSICLSQLKDACAAKSVIISDLHQHLGKDRIHLNVVAPVINNNGNIIAVLLCIINPDKYLYPLIQSWPTLSKTGETLIVRKDGDSVLFLNELRHRKNSALSFRLPLTKTDLPAVQALNKQGSFRGVDYRGINVLSDLRHIAGTNWYMITKVDSDEILSELSYKTDVIILLVSVLIILSFSGAGLIYRSRQKNHFRNLFLKEKELSEIHKEFRTTLYSIGDAIITVSTNGKVRAMNHVAEQLTGWQENEAAGKPIENVFVIINESSLAPVENPITKVLKEGIVVGLANHTLLISKNGDKIPIADSGAPIKNDYGEVIGVVLVFRDQTEERRYQNLLEESNNRFLSLFTNMDEGVALHELIMGEDNTPVNYRIIDVNPQFESILGFKRNDVIGKPATEVYSTVTAPYLTEYSKVALTGKSISFETFFETMGKHFKISVAPWLNNGFATIFSDITKRKNAEDALQKRVLALTQPLSNLDDISITDLFNIDDLQKLQDSFANATGVASLITDPSGMPITAPTNFCKLCKDIIRSTDQGMLNCMKSDKSIGRFNPDGPTVQPCLSGGLWDAGASISIGGKHLASWLVGQVRNEAIDENHILNYADEIGADREEIRKAFYNVPEMSKEKFESITEALFSFANELSLKAYQNIQQARFIAERKVIEEELRLREENLEITLNSIGDAVISTNLEGKVTNLNPVACSLTGWEKTDALNKPLSEIFNIINAGTRETLESPVTRVIMEGIIIGLANHTILISKDGSEKQIADSAAPIKDKAGKTIGVVLVFSDVTKEYEIYKELEENEKFLKNSQVAGRIGSYLMDIKADKWNCSEVMDKILGIDNNYEKSTAGWINIVHPEYRQIMADYFVDYVLNNKNRFDKEYKILRKSDGEERWVHGLGELEIDQNGTPSYMIGTIQDVTDRVNAQHELEEYKNHLEELIAKRTEDLDNANRKLVSEINKQKEYELMLQSALKKEQELSELKTRFISTTSHEFRTPLTSILSSADLVKRYGAKWEKSKVDEHLDRIKFSVNHLTHLLDDVLTISRTETGKINFNPQLLDLKELCNEIIIEAQSHSNNNHTFNFLYEIEKIEYFLDPKLIRFMLLNLLSNAFKYSPNGGNVTLTILGKGQELSFKVEDDGIGISEEDRKRLFEPFHRGNNVSDISGTGLGLSIVQKSVEIHGGQINYISALGKGTTFTIIIPLIRNEEKNTDN